MIITKSPLRLTLGGGGTDLASYYSEHEGFCISAAIDKYVYITLHENFVNEIWLKYSQNERVKSIDEIQHPIFREAFRALELNNKWLEISSLADIPAGTGLGSSGSFTTALLKAMHIYKSDITSTRRLAEEACDIEINKLGNRIGKQDQYIAAYGGITCMTFRKDGYVWVEPLNISHQDLYSLEDNLAMFFTGYSHSASDILREQDDRSKSGNKAMTENLHEVKRMGYESKDALEHGRLDDFAEIMNVHWQRKKERSGGMSNPQIDEWYEYALKNGAIGGKLIGAGGGGFLLFYCRDKIKLRHAMNHAGLMEVRFRFDPQGTRTAF